LSEPESKMMQLAAKYRDASQVPTPKIYAIDDAFESMRGAGSDQGPVFKALFQRLAADPRVTEQIDAFETWFL